VAVAGANVERERGRAFVPVQVAVDSLLQFLRVKGGQGPNALSLDVSPSMDVTDFYGMQSLVTTNQTGAAAAIGNLFGPASTAPRRYVGISGNVTIGAAAGTWLTLGVGYQDPTGAAVVLEANTFTPIVGALYRIALKVDNLILPNGYIPALFAAGNAGGADHVAALQYSYQRLDGLP